MLILHNLRQTVTIITVEAGCIHRQKLESVLSAITQKIINVFSYEYPVTLRMIDGWPLFTRINLTNIWDAKVVSDQHPELMGHKLTTHSNQQISLVSVNTVD